MKDGSTSTVSQKHINKGGLKLCHFEKIITALKLFWTKRLIPKKTQHGIFY